MTSYWDFRAVLGVDPDDGKCVGNTKTGNRCENPINKSDRSTASRLINQMNQTKRFLDSKVDVQQLAELTLCKGFHNSLSRPKYSQVDDTCDRWTRMIEAEYRAIRKREKDLAVTKAKKEARRSERRSGEKNEKMPVYKDTEKSYINTVVTEVVEDPFVINRTKSSTRSNGPTVLRNVSTNFSMKRVIPAPIKLGHAPPPISQASPKASSPLHLQEFPLPPSKDNGSGLATPDSTPVKGKAAKSHERKASGGISLFPQIKTLPRSSVLLPKRGSALPPSPPASLLDVNDEDKVPLIESTPTKTSSSASIREVEIGSWGNTTAVPIIFPTAPTGMIKNKYDNDSLITKVASTSRPLRAESHSSLEGKSVAKVLFSFGLSTNCSSKKTEETSVWDETKTWIFTRECVPKSHVSHLENWSKEPVFDFSEAAAPKSYPFEPELLHITTEKQPLVFNSTCTNQTSELEYKKSPFSFDLPVQKKSGSTEEEISFVAPLSVTRAENKTGNVKSMPVASTNGRTIKAYRRHPLADMKSVGERRPAEALLCGDSVSSIEDEEHMIMSPFPFESQVQVARVGSTQESAYSSNSLSVGSGSPGEQRVEEGAFVSGQAGLNSSADSVVEFQVANKTMFAATYATQEGRLSEMAACADDKINFGEVNKENIPPSRPSANHKLLSINTREIKERSVVPFIPLRSPHRRQESDDNKSLQGDSRILERSRHISIPLRSPYRPQEIPFTPTTNAESADDEAGYGYATITPAQRYSTYLPSSYRKDTPPKMPELTIWRGRTASDEGSLRSWKREEKALPPLPAMITNVQDGGQGREVRASRSNASGRILWKGVDVGVQTEDMPWNGTEVAQTIRVGGERRSEGGLFGRMRDGVARKLRGVRRVQGKGD